MRDPQEILENGLTGWEPDGAGPDCLVGDREGFERLMPHRGLRTAACFDVWLATFHILEMLYDTPFPETPQNDLTPKKTVRNAEIMKLYEAGETGVNIAKAFGISEQRVNQIIRDQRR